MQRKENGFAAPLCRHTIYARKSQVPPQREKRVSRGQKPQLELCCSQSLALVQEKINTPL